MNSDAESQKTHRPSTSPLTSKKQPIGLYDINLSNIDSNIDSDSIAFQPRSSLKKNTYKKLRSQFEQLAKDMATKSEESQQRFEERMLQILQNQQTAQSTNTKVTAPQLVVAQGENNANGVDADNLLTKVGAFLSKHRTTQEDMIKNINTSLNTLPPAERDGFFGGTKQAIKAFESGFDVKSGLKWGGSIFGVSIIATLGGCLAKAHAETNTSAALDASDGLGENLKDVMSEVFPEALVALAAAALLIAVTRTVSGALSGTVDQFASTHSKRELANAQDKITNAQNKLIGDPLNLTAHEELETAMKEMMKLGSEQVFKLDPKTNEMTKQPAIAPTQLEKLKECLNNVTKARRNVTDVKKLKDAERAVRQGGGKEVRVVSAAKQKKNTLKGKGDRNNEKNDVYLKRLATKLGITMGIADKIMTQSVSEKATIPKNNGLDKK